tara:strand:- start:69832 stop:72417 length:2586 start_codon:yes stop_codon:yes gene_type:complete
MLLALCAPANSVAQTPVQSRDKVPHLERCGLEDPQNTPPPLRVLPKEDEVPGLGASGLPPVMHARAITEGALLGKTVYVSPGHGWNWSNDAWRSQRGNTHGIVEDLISTEVATQYLVKYLRNMGAHVVTLRENDLNSNIALTDDASASFAVLGALELRDEAKGYAIPDATYEADHRPFRAGSSKVFDTGGEAGRGVRWTFDVPEDGNYHVYIGYVQGPDRASDAKYTVKHAGGQSVFHVDQRRHGNTWVFLGNFYFKRGASDELGALELSTESADEGSTLSADIARIGGGHSQAARGGVSHGRPAFEDSALNYLQSAGAPDHVLVNDVQARSRFAAWDHEDGEDAVYIAWHTNAANGTARGTSSFAYGPTSFGNIDTFSGVDGSVELLTAVHDELVADLREGWDSEWPEFGNGLYAAYFGEVNPSNNSEMPSGLFEIAFHDTAEDAAALADPRFRRIAGRAMAQGVARYFADRDGEALTLPPDEPRLVGVEQVETALRFHWTDPAIEPGGGEAATRYRIYLSADGLSFDDGQDVVGTSFEIDGQTARFARITALNAGGESFPSAIVGARASNLGTPQVLIVNDYARLDAGQLIHEDLSDFSLDTVKRMLLGRMNDYSHVARYGRAIDAAGISFASISAQALRAGDVNLEDYTLVLWAAGETKDDLLASSDVARLARYHAGGGILVMSGSHIAESLGAGDEAAAALLRDTLAVDGVEPGGQSFSLTPAEGAPASLVEMRFDDDAEHGYLAEGADKLTPTAQGQALLYYQDEGTALITASNSALLAFPFETIVGESERANLMGVVLTSLRLVPDEVPDLSEPEDPKNPETSGCGCHATKQPLGSLAPWLLLFAFALARRRKRL